MCIFKGLLEKDFRKNFKDVGYILNVPKYITMFDIAKKFKTNSLLQILYIKITETHYTQSILICRREHSVLLRKIGVKMSPKRGLQRGVKSLLSRDD